ncbi:MAG TPA: hypothetical protein VF524_01765 [Polyangia bacterium]
MPTIFASSRLARLPLGKHLGPLAGLVLLHIAVFERSLRGAEGLPNQVIPYDFFNSYARMLIYISDCLRSYVLPLWFPYGHAGTPFFMNPQSQLWSPVTWLVSLAVGYDPLITQQQQFVILLLGSVGVYFLGYELWAHRSSGLVAAIAFNFTSARLCNSEHMDIITAFSIFPWVLLAIRGLARGQRLAAPLLGALLGLMLVSGYPGIVLTSPLWFGSWAVWCGVTECADGPSRKRFALGLAVSAAICLGVSAGYWIPIAANMGTFTRGDPMTTDAALSQSLFPGDLWHFVYGASTRLTPESYNTDISMRGLYFGIVALALALYAVLFRRERVTTFWCLGFLAAMVMSLGRFTFVRVALHDYLPLLNLSRFPPADSRPVAALAGCLLAGAGLAHLRDDPDARPRLLRIFVAFLVLLLLGQFWLKGVIYPFVSIELVNACFPNPVYMEIGVVAVALVVIVRSFRPAMLAAFLVVVSGFDSGTHTVADAALFAVPVEPPMKRLTAIHSTFFDPSKALLPRVDSASIEDQAANDAYLNKSFYLASYTHFQLKRLHELLAKGFKPFLLNGKRVVGFVDGAVPDNGGLFQVKAGAVKFSIIQYLPGRVDYLVDLPVATNLVFNEVYFPGWRARVDGKSVGAMGEAAGGLRSLKIPAGQHIIVTRFLPTSFFLGLTLTVLSWLFVLGWMVRIVVRARRAALAPAATPGSAT